MKPTPLLPRPCPLPLTSLGLANSRCSWQSPKACLVDTALFAVAAPSAMTHFSPPFQAPMFLPSKRTIASEGGPPSVPGVTCFGFSQTMPLSYTLGWPASLSLGPNRPRSHSAQTARVARLPRSNGHRPARSLATRHFIEVLLSWWTRGREYCPYRMESAAEPTRAGLRPLSSSADCRDAPADAGEAEAGSSSCGTGRG